MVTAISKCLTCHNKNSGLYTEKSKAIIAVLQPELNYNTPSHYPRVTGIILTSYPRLWGLCLPTIVVNRIFVSGTVLFLPSQGSVAGFDLVLKTGTLTAASRCFFLTVPPIMQVRILQTSGTLTTTSRHLFQYNSYKQPNRTEFCEHTFFRAREILARRTIY